MLAGVPPSDKAACEVVKYPPRTTEERLGLRVQAVVMTIGAEAADLVPGARSKVSAAGVAETVSDSPNVALIATLAPVEFSWPKAVDETENAAAINAAIAMGWQSESFDFMMSAPWSCMSNRPTLAPSNHFLNFKLL